MRGSGPLGREPGGSFNFRLNKPDEVLYFERSPRWVRVRFGGETVADSRRTMLLHDPAALPCYYFPVEDVRTDLLSPSRHRQASDSKGMAVFHTLTVGDYAAPDAAWTYPESPAGCPPLHGYFAFSWRAMDAWLEENEEVYAHARDPYHRVDALQSARHLIVAIAGEVLADTRQPVAVFETAQPTRWYLPVTDVRMDLLRAEPTRSSRCPYKGVASYWSADLSSGTEPLLAWTYSEPKPGVAAIAARVCFFDERVDLDLDGERQVRPHTPWSSPDWGRRLDVSR